MAAGYEVHQNVDLKYVRIQGFTHLDELRNLASAYREDPLFSHRRQLIDLSQLKDARARFKDVMTLRNFYLRLFGPVPEPIPVAIAAPTDLGFGIARMFYMLMLGNALMNIRIFNDLPSACDWFGIEMQINGDEVAFSTSPSAASSESG